MTAINCMRRSRLVCCVVAAGFLFAVTGCQEKPAAPSAGYYTGPMKAKSLKATSDTTPPAGTSAAGPQ
jgi:hypothetical protein